MAPSTSTLSSNSSSPGASPTHRDQGEDRTSNVMPIPPYTICDQGLTYSNPPVDAGQLQHQHLRELPPPFIPDDESTLPQVPLRRSRINMNVIVDIEAILPEALQDPRTGQLVLNLDSIYMMTFRTEALLYEFIVDDIKKGIQDLCWNNFRIPVRKRDFKLWLQVIPPGTPMHPYGRYEPLDFDSTWGEVLNSHQISFATEQIILRAHHPEGLFD